MLFGVFVLVVSWKKGEVLLVVVSCEVVDSSLGVSVFMCLMVKCIVGLVMVIMFMVGWLVKCIGVEMEDRFRL